MKELPPRNDAGAPTGVWLCPEAIEAALRHLEDRLIRAVKDGHKPGGKGAPEDEATGPLLLTADDLAELLQISKRHIWRMVEMGELPASIEFGPKLIRWAREEVLAWIEAGCPPRQVWEARRPKGGRGKLGDSNRIQRQ